MSDQPHSSWAEVYDIAYQRSFGDFYTQLTDATVELIISRVTLPARIVDFGAGTGRLSIPLSRHGYEVTAVDPCQAMLDQLNKKDCPEPIIKTVCASMENFRGQASFDAALCVFTVILYLLTEESLKRSLAVAHASLKPGGILILDIPSESLFHGYSRRDHTFGRSVTVTHLHDSIYTYREEMYVNGDDGEPIIYQDEFRIRHWPSGQVRDILQDIGFMLTEDLTTHFSGTGSSYFILRKV